MTENKVVFGALVSVIVASSFLEHQDNKRASASGAAP